MRSLIVFSLLSILVAVSVNAASPWVSCGQPSDIGVPTDVILTPDPPVRNNDEIVTLEGTVKSQISGGNVALTITYLGIPVYSNKWDICTVTHCPIATGDFAANLTVPGTSIPPISPAGDYTGTGIITDSAGAEICCVKVTFTLP